ncbi:MAG: class I SAM-dependent methyltransferase, partial [Geminicoccaceae bacterium]
MGLATLLGRKRGFFIPHRYAGAVEPCAYPALEPYFAACVPAFEAVLADIEAQAGRLETLRGPAPEPRFDQAWFPTLDAAAAYAMVRRTRPARIVEVGSGHSTRFLARAIADAGLDTELTCIDPAPRAPLRDLPVRWLETVVQQAPASLFERLRTADILFIDSSHILMPGTDVDWLLNRILPGLTAGVLVHFHD